MGTLGEILTADDVRRQVIDDCCQLIEDEVRSKRGVSGMAIKGGFKAFKKVKPGALPTAVHNLLDEFAAAVDPFYQEHLKSGKGGSVARTILPQRGRVADALLAITDRRSQRFRGGLIKKTYQKLRPMAKRHTEDAIPGVCRLIDKYAG